MNGIFCPSKRNLIFRIYCGVFQLQHTKKRNTTVIYHGCDVPFFYFTILFYHFFQFFYDNGKIAGNLLRIGKQIVKQAIQVILKVVRQNCALRPAQLHQPLFSGVGQFIPCKKNIKIRFQECSCPVIDADPVISSNRLRNLMIIGWHRPAKQLHISVNDIIF